MFSQLLEKLFSLERVRITTGTRFTFVWDYPVAIALGAIALAVIGYLSYIPQAASPRKKRAMGIVRALLLAVLLILCFRPELVMEHEEKTRSVVAVWLDDSSSMQLEDPYTGKNDAAMNALLVHVKTSAQSQPAGAPAQARPNRYQIGTSVLNDAKWLRDLAETQDVVFFSGGAHAVLKGSSASESIDSIITRLKAEQPIGTSTDVPAVIKDILANVQGQRLSAIILLTDGQTTEKGSRADQAALAAQDSDVRLFAIPLGQEDEPFDLKLSAPSVPAKTFIKDPVAMKVHVSGTGITAPTIARINIYRKPPTSPNGAATAPSGQPLATKDVTLEPDQREIDVDIPLKLEKTIPGSEEFELIARVEPLGGAQELYVNNNQQSAKTTVIDDQINVLYVEGYPRWEFRYLKNELIREPTVNIATLLLSADDDFVQDADPPVHDKQGKEKFPGAIRRFPETMDELSKFHVLILGDVEPTYFTPSQQRLIVDWVKTRGGGMAWIAGSLYNPEAYRETPMSVLLPITPDEMDPRARIVAASDNTPYNLQLTPAGKALNLFRFFDEPEKSWSQVNDLPQMYWYKPVQGLKPGAIVLATHPTRSQAGNPAPLLVMRPYVSGQVIFSAYCDTWRWRRYTGEPLFQSYWLQMCRLLYNGNALGQDRRADLLADSSQLEIGASTKITLNIKDPTLLDQLPPEIPLKVFDAANQPVETVTLQRVKVSTAADPARIDRFEGSFTAGRLGTVSLAIPPGTLPLELPPLSITAETSRREQENVTTDIPSLSTLTAKTNGKIIPPTATDELAHLIPDRSLPVLIAQPEELWNKPFALILVILLATTEWLIRKSAGLI